MSTKHTPGPWRLNDVGNVESDAVHNIALVYQSAIQENWSGSDFSTLAHCEANAHLIAAAPELLEALRVAHDHLDMQALEVSHCKDAALIRSVLSRFPCAA